MSEVKRLVDMVVEEVSMVDRAANKRRFLLVKRDDMEDENKNETTNETPTGQEGEIVEEKAAGDAPADGGAPPAGDSAADPGMDGEAPADPVLATAVSALEVLTELVESLGESGATPESSARLAELAQSLGDIAQSILSQVGGAPAAEQKSDKTGDLIKQAKALVDQFGGQVAASAEKQAKSEVTLTKSITDINQAVGRYEQMLKEIHERVKKVEKSVGAPASQPVTSVSKSAGEDLVSWPDDLNAPIKPKTRENA